MLRALILAALICASCGGIHSLQPTVETLTVNNSRPTTVINIKNDATSATAATTTSTTTTNTQEPATTDTNMNVTPLTVKMKAALTSTDQVIDSNNNRKNKHNNSNMDMNNVVNDIKENEENERLYYHPAEDKKPRVVEEYSRHFLDGSYEYK